MVSGFSWGRWVTEGHQPQREGMLIPDCIPEEEVIRGPFDICFSLFSALWDKCAKQRLGLRFD